MHACYAAGAARAGATSQLTVLYVPLTAECLVSR